MGLKPNCVTFLQKLWNFCLPASVFQPILRRLMMEIKKVAITILLVTVIILGGITVDWDNQKISSQIDKKI